MKSIILILCATLTTLLLPMQARAAKTPAQPANTNPGGRANYASEDPAAPSADVCPCGSGPTLNQAARGATELPGTIHAGNAATPSKGSGKAGNAERPSGG